MKILRSVTRRGFTVGTAGWFTITSPNRWFAASRLPRKSRYLSEEFQTIAGSQGIRHSGSQEAAVLPRIMTLERDKRHPMRIALILLASMAITLALLCWIVRPR